MDVRYLELSAANKECKEKFTDIAKVVYKGKPIFEYARDYVNESPSYKRTGRHLELVSISDYSMMVKLTSESKLEMASKSLAGFSRELLRVDLELNPSEDERLFRMFVYNNTLFRNVQVEAPKSEGGIDYAEMSDVDALKLCVEIFCNNMTSTKEEAVILASSKKKIKQILGEYQRMNRLSSYAKKVGGH